MQWVSGQIFQIFKSMHTSLLELKFITLMDFQDYKCFTISNYKSATDIPIFFVTIDQMEKMESGYLCEVLHFILKKRHGTPLVKLPVDLADVDNEASLDLLRVLFKHCKCRITIITRITPPVSSLPCLSYIGCSYFK